MPLSPEQCRCRYLDVRSSWNEDEELRDVSSAAYPIEQIAIAQRIGDGNQVRWRAITRKIGDYLIDRFMSAGEMLGANLTRAFVKGSRILQDRAENSFLRLDALLRSSIHFATLPFFCRSRT